MSVRDMCGWRPAGILVEPIPGRRRHPRDHGRSPQGPAARIWRRSSACSCSNDEIIRVFGVPARCGATDLVGRRKPDRGGDRQGHGRRLFRSAPSWRPKRRRSAWCRARTARPTAANPLAKASPTPCSTSSWRPGFIDGVRERGEYLKGKLQSSCEASQGLCRAARQRLPAGPACTPEVPAGDLVNRLQSLGLLCLGGRERDRVFPALIADKAALDEGIDLLSKAAVSFNLPRRRVMPWQSPNTSST